MIALIVISKLQFNCFILLKTITYVHILTLSLCFGLTTFFPKVNTASMNLEAFSM
jgi:hypothetical protein